MKTDSFDELLLADIQLDFDDFDDFKHLYYHQYLPWKLLQLRR